MDGSATGHIPQRQLPDALLLATGAARAAELASLLGSCYPSGPWERAGLHRSFLMETHVGYRIPGAQVFVTF